MYVYLKFAVRVQCQLKKKKKTMCKKRQRMESLRLCPGVWI